MALVDIDGSATERVASTLPAGQSLPLVADVTDIESMRAAAARTLEVFGRLDVAIANAGILGRAATFRTLGPDDVGRVLAVNVTGAVNTAAAATESVIANRGQIVVVSSVYTFMNGAGAIPYAMSKAAVAQLGRGLAIELAPHGASAMTAYFSLLETDMIRHGIDAHPDALAVLETSPSFLLKRIQPRVAATAIVHGLEVRAQRVLLPRRWRPLASLQGIVGPVIERKNAPRPQDPRGADEARAIRSCAPKDPPSRPRPGVVALREGDSMDLKFAGSARISNLVARRFPAIGRKTTERQVHQYRSSGGRKGNTIVGRPVFLLDVIGRTSGELRPVMLMYVPRGDDLIVVGSGGGSATTPNWYRNLMAAGGAEVQVGSERWAVKARELGEGPERDACWSLAPDVYPGFDLPRVHRSPHPGRGARARERGGADWASAGGTP